MFCMLTGELRTGISLKKAYKNGVKPESYMQKGLNNNIGRQNIPYRKSYEAEILL